MVEYDVLLKGGVVVDGSGAPPFKADIGIVGDEIVKIGDLTGASSEKTINAEGLIVTPGFIDIHNHSDLSIFNEPSAHNYVMQGVTTIVVGNCGFSAAPVTDANRGFLRRFWEALGLKADIKWETFSEYLKHLDELEKSINILTLVGHGTVRSAVLGVKDSTPSDRELLEMKELIEDAMRVGAFGMSTGLIYEPGAYATTHEIIELAKTTSKHGGLYATHIRNESDTVVEALLEAIEVGVKANIPVQISHHKIFGRKNWGLSKTTLSIMDYFNSRGLDITCDAYPYTAGMTYLLALLPPWTRTEGLDGFLERVKSEHVKSKIIEELRKPSKTWENLLYNAGLDEVKLAYAEHYREYIGLSLLEISRELKLNPYDLIIDILEKDGYKAMVIVGGICEDDMDNIIKHPLTMISTDGAITKYEHGKPHPRFYGTYPRTIAKYVKDGKTLRLEEAIRKMTSLPARKFKLWDRGLIRPKFKADIVIFNYYTLTDTATYQNPHRYPEGIKYVIVNGKIVVDNGRLTGEKPGCLIRYNVER